MTPYQYCGNNPIMFIDPTGMKADPIYDTNGNVIGDDGKVDGNAYVVNNKLGKKIKEATDKGECYTGDLELGTNGASVPTGEVLDQVINSVNDTDANKVENGGHSMYGENTATRWDSGPEYSFTKIENSSRMVDETFNLQASIKSFVTNGKRLNFTKLKDVEFAWHTHPLIVIPSLGKLGSSNPSGSADGTKPGDITNMIKYVNSGFRGTNFVIGLRDKNVQFYNDKGSYLKISYDVFKKIGNKQ